MTTRKQRQHEKRLARLHARPLGPREVDRQKTHLLKLSDTNREEAINSLSYAAARQLCHELGMRRIKGNARRVLNRRIARLIKFGVPEHVEVML